MSPTLSARMLNLIEQRPCLQVHLGLGCSLLPKGQVAGGGWDGRNGGAGKAIPSARTETLVVVGSGEMKKCRSRSAAAGDAVQGGMGGKHGVWVLDSPFKCAVWLSHVIHKLQPATTRSTVGGCEPL